MTTSRKPELACAIVVPQFALIVGMVLIVSTCSQDTVAGPDTSPTRVASLQFESQPTRSFVGAVIAPTVVVRTVDDAGRPVQTNSGAVTLVLRSRTSTAALGGVTTAALNGGAATFSDLTVGSVGGGYFLEARLDGVPPVVSDTFGIVPNPVIVDSTQFKLVSDPADRANGRFAFSTSGAAPNISAGDVVVVGEQGGFLRRVTSKQITGGQVVLQTTPASLVDVLRDGNLHDVMVLDLKTGTARGTTGQIKWGKPYARGQANLTVPLGSADFGIQNKTLIGTPTSGLTVDNLGASISAELELDLSFGFFSIKKALIALSSTVAFDASASLGVNARFDANGELPLGPPIIIPFVATIPGTPIPVKGDVSMQFVATASIGVGASAKLNASMSGSKTLRIGASYDEGSWNSILENPGQFNAPSLTVNAGTNLDASVGVKAIMGLTLFNSAGADISGGVRGNWGGTIDLAQGTMQTRCSVSTDVDLGMHLSILSFDLASYNRTLAGAEFPIGSCDRNILLRPAASVSISPAAVSLQPGQSAALHATVVDALGVPVSRPLTWTSSAPTRVRVNNDGTVDALSVGGPVTVFAEADGIKGSAVVNVGSGIPVANSITLEPFDLFVAIGQTTPLVPQVKDAQGNILTTHNTLQWGSADPAIATVSQLGFVTGHSVGTIIISAITDGVIGKAVAHVTAAWPAPTVSAIAPALPVASTVDQGITITGTGFQQGLTATIKLADGSTIVRSGSQVQEITATSARVIGKLAVPGATSVRVTNSDGKSSIDFPFTISSASQTLSITSTTPPAPAVSQQSQLIRIFGAGFTQGLSLTVVAPNQVTTVVSGNQIQNVAPTSFEAVMAFPISGSYTLRVTSVSGAVSAAFALSTNQSTSLSPVVASISPTAMTANSGNQLLTINGSNFQSGNVVQFMWGVGNGAGVWNPSSNTPSINGAAQITVSMNPGSVNDVINVRVCRSANQTTASDCSSGTHAVTVTAATGSPDLRVINGSVSPLSASGGGSVSGLWTISNQGTGSASASQTFVRVNQSASDATAGTPVFFTTQNAGVLAAGGAVGQNVQFAAPPTAGTYYVWIIADNTNSAGQTSAARSNDTQLIGSFTVNAQAPTAPAVTSISPNAMAANSGNQLLTINGSNFQSANVVQFMWGVGNGAGVWNLSNSTPSINGATQITVSMNPGSVSDVINVRVCRSASQTSAGDCSSGTHAVTVTAATNAPDLNVINGSVSPPSVNSGGTVSGSWTISNQGTGSAGASQTFVRVNQSSSDATAGNAVFFTTLNAAALGAGGAVGQNVQFTAPAATGIYYVWIVADNTNTAGQTSAARSNDVQLIGSFTVTTQAPTAPVVTSISPTSMTANSGNQLLTINGSNFQSGNVVQFMWGVGNGAGVWSQSNSTPSINGATQITVSMNPGSVSDVINVRVCRSGSQTSAADCSSGTHAVTVSAATNSPDLHVINGSVSPPTVSGGGSVSGSWTISNQGSGSAGASQTFVRVNQSASDAAAGNAAFFTTQAAIALAAGGAVGQNVQFAAPTAAGTYYVWIIADNTNSAGQTSAARSNDTQLIGSFSVTSAVTSPDLRVTNGSVSPSSVNGGGTVSGSWTISNQGTGSAATSQTFVRVNQSSSDATAGNAVFFTTLTASALAAGGAVGQNVQFGAPTAAGTYYVWIIADNTNSAGQPSSARSNDTQRIGSFTVTAPAPAPNITSVSPNPVSRTGVQQPFTINGSNFVSGANITLKEIGGQVYQNRVPSSFTSTRIVINPNFGTNAATWQVWVVNPDGQTSNIFTFQVQ